VVSTLAGRQGSSQHVCSDGEPGRWGSKFKSLSLTAIAENHSKTIGIYPHSLGGQTSQTQEPVGRNSPGPLPPPVGCHHLPCSLVHRHIRTVSDCVPSECLCDFT
jgi:hypothetical protein